MKFTDIIKKINEDKRLIPDLMKSEKGNNFRAVSESAILDVVDPVLKEAGLYYTVEIKKSDLQIREAYCKNGKKLQFIATVEIKVKFKGIDVEADTGFSPILLPENVETESVGMGIDDNDKAMGKAFTYALKYALLKVFRLRYADDPDFRASEDLLTEKPKEKKEEKPAKATKSDKKSAKETPMTESQRDFILGLMKQKGITDSTIIGKFGYEPNEDEFIPMKTARAIIEWLQEQEDLPF